MIVHCFIKHKTWTNVIKCSSDVFWTKSRLHFAGWVCTAHAAEGCASHKMLVTNTGTKSCTKTVKHQDITSASEEFLRCRLGEIWEDTGRKQHSFLNYTLCILLLKYLSEALLGQWVLSWKERGLTGCACLDVRRVYGLVWLIPHAFETALIQYCTCWEDLPLWQRHNTNEMCLEGVLRPVNIGKLKFLTMVNP